MMIHLNGRLVPVGEARIDPFDRGLTLGDGLFETIRVADGAPRRLGRHLSRLRAGAALMDIPVPLDDDALAAAIEEVLRANEFDEAALRLTLTRGPGARGLVPPSEPQPTLIIAAASLPPPAGPARAIIARSTRRNERSPLARCKCLAYADHILARAEAARNGADEALLLNTRERLVSATVANLFAVVDGVVVTPPVTDGALPGVMRAEAVDQLDAAERSLTPDDLARAEEAFLTNCLSIRPLVAVDGRPIGDGVPGPVARALVAAMA